MYTGGSAEYLVEQGLYYPTTPNYGYYSTGFESPADWDDHQRFFSLDGLDVQYTGAQTETVPYVYYTPSYGYAESPYNPYNPYIPGAMIGVDDPFSGPQPYYTIPPYQTAVSSPAYFPVGSHSAADTIPTSSQDLLLDTGSSATNIFCPGLTQNISSPSPIIYLPSQAPASNQTHSIPVPENSRVHAGPSNQAVTLGSTSSSSFRNVAPAHAQQGRGSSSVGQALENEPNGRVVSHPNQLQVPLPFNTGLSSNTNHRPPADNVQRNFSYNSSLVDVNGNSDALTDQNRGPRTNKSKKLLLNAHTTMAGDGHAQGNIISIDQYNKVDFCVNYVVAKFFVIKSYSEDDVHKSVKYDVWSSTPNGNKKLNIAFEDAQRIAGQSRHCPIFLFFSVNASGQFVGIAEMIGPVDFERDMDFWQQDKWSGSFPVKWHIIKDIPNTNFRHIVLENNENKPVTNSRDTQEIKHRQGLEMLKIFKSYTLKTCLLDDFQYYENRQKYMQGEKARILMKSFASPFFNNTADPPRKHAIRLDPPQTNSDPLCSTNLSHKDITFDPIETAPSTSNVTSNEQIEDSMGIEAKDEKLFLASMSKGIESKLNASSLAGKSVDSDIAPKGNEGKLKKASFLAEKSVSSDTEPKGIVAKLEKVSSLAGKSVDSNTNSKGIEAKLVKVSSLAGKPVDSNTDSKGIESKLVKAPSLAGKSVSSNTDFIETKLVKVSSLAGNSASSSTDCKGVEAKQERGSSLAPSPTQADGVVKVGSVPVKVNGFATSFVTVGTIPLDPTSLLADKSRVSVKGSKLL